MEKTLLDPIEAAAVLSISRSKLYELMAGGRIGSSGSTAAGGCL
jgi:hypothetical protein